MNYCATDDDVECDDVDDSVASGSDYARKVYRLSKLLSRQRNACSPLEDNVAETIDDDDVLL